MSEFAESREVRVHEIKSEFAESRGMGVHETESEFAESRGRACTKLSRNLSKAGEGRARNQVGIRRFAGGFLPVTASAFAIEQQGRGGRHFQQRRKKVALPREEKSIRRKRRILSYKNCF